MKKEILYISYTGMMEPLGKSQVFNYLKILSKEYRISIISLEKKDDFNNDDLMRGLANEMSSFEIEWYRREYIHGMLGYLSNFYGTIQIVRNVLKTHHIVLIHCRSYLPAMVAFICNLGLTKKIPYLFDTRGFWVDEKADLGEWKKSSLGYRIFKKVERRLFMNASYSVMLSKKSIDIIRSNKLFRGGDKVSNIQCIYTCTDLEKFYPKAINNNQEEPLIIGYVGNAIGWYDFESTLRVVKKIGEKRNIEFVIYNNGQHDYINAKLSQFDVIGKVESVSFENIPEKIRAFDLSIFYISPLFSKQASAATKLGELLASGIPVITNGDVGDHQILLESFQAGKIVNPNEIETTNFEQLLNELLKTEVAVNCRKLAISHFSLENGALKYSEIYQKIIL